MAKSILLVEDSITMQKVVEMTFSAEDFDLTAVATGEEAMEAIEANQPDIVITDLSLDGQSGYDVCKTVKQNNGMPVLLLHGTASSYNESKARAAGADGDISKPFETQALIDKVKALTAAGAMPAELEAEGTASPTVDAVERPKRRTVPPPLPTRSKRITKGPPPPRRPRTTPPPPPPPPKAAMVQPEPPKPEPPPPIMEAPTVAVKAPPPMEPEPQDEIVIEAELPPQTTAEPLPSFESQTQDRITAPPMVASPKDAPADTVTLKGFEAPDDLPEPPTTVPAEPPKAVETAPAVDPAAYDAIAKLSQEIIEKVVWEVVPDLAEKIIREELDRLVEKRK